MFEKKMVGDISNSTFQEGQLLVITGPMFSGKTEELIRVATRMQYADLPFLVFKPSIDTRYAETEVVTHNGINAKALNIVPGEETWDNLEKISNGRFSKAALIAFDEAHMYSPKIVDLCLKLMDAGKTVVVAALDLDFSRKPFEHIAQLLAYADEVKKLRAICTKCKQREARLTYRKIAGDRIIVGGKELYEARCKLCHEIPKEK